MSHCTYTEIYLPCQWNSQLSAHTVQTLQDPLLPVHLQQTHTRQTISHLCTLHGSNMYLDTYPTLNVWMSLLNITNKKKQVKSIVNKIAHTFQAKHLTKTSLLGHVTNNDSRFESVRFDFFSSENAFNRSKVTVKTCIMLQKISIKKKKEN